MPARSLPFGTEALSLCIGMEKHAAGRPMTVGLSAVGTVVRAGIGGEVPG
ncbi:MAG: hypothetical protein ACE5MG_06040 [Candidatus Methylomirabilales bacterium]